MKAKRGYSGLESIPLSFSTDNPELFRLSGNDARMRQINGLFDSGNEEEARRLLRKTIDEVTRGLDTLLADGGAGGDAVVTGDSGGFSRLRQAFGPGS